MTDHGPCGLLSFTQGLLGLLETLSRLLKFPGDLVEENSNNDRCDRYDQVAQMRDSDSPTSGMQAPPYLVTGWQGKVSTRKPDP